MQQLIQRINQSSIRKLKLRSLLGIMLISLITMLALVIAVNRGVYYAEFEPVTVLQFPTTTTADFFNQFSGAKYVAKVNHELKQVTYQGLTLPQVNALVSKLDTKPLDIVEQHQILEPGLISRIFWVAGFLVVLTLLYVYYSIIRELKVDNKWRLISLTLVKLAALGLGLLGYLGLLSLASRAYQLTDVSFVGLLLVTFFGLAVIYISLLALKRQEMLRFNELYHVESLTLVDGYAWVRRTWRLAALVILFISIGMGINFAFDGLLIWAGILFVIASVVFLPELILIIWSRKWDRLMNTNLVALDVPDLTPVPISRAVATKAHAKKPKKKRRR